MKKQYFAFCLFIGLSVASSAQPNITGVAAIDDFSTATEFNDPITGRGLYWWAGVGQTLTRDNTHSELDVVMTQGAYQYVPFGVGFGDDNGALAGGIPYTIDLSANGTFSFDIKNTGTQGLSVRVAAVDADDKLIDCINAPNTVTNANFGAEVWKYQTQIIVPVGQTISFVAGSQNGAGGNVLNTADFTKGMWGDYGQNPHVIRRDYDLTRIKGVNITVLNSAKNLTDGHALALTDGKFSISNFKVGDITAGIFNSASTTNSFSMYPNPAKNNVTIKNNSLLTIDNPIQVLDVYGKLISTINKSTTDDFVIDVSKLEQGVYFVNIGGQLQKLVIE